MKWPEVPIKDVADVVSGFGFPREHQGNVGEEYPFFKVGDMNLPGNEKEMTVKVNTISEEVRRELNAKAFPSGTIVFPKIGAAIATNKKRMLAIPSLVDNNVMGLIPNLIIDKWYLFYWMQQFDLKKVSNTGPVPSMRKSDVEQVIIPLPTLSEQRRIVEILDQADALRKKRTEVDKKAERILPSLFYKMFGDPLKNPNKWTPRKLASISDINPRPIIGNLSDDSMVSFVPMADVDERWGFIVGKQVRRLQDVIRGFTYFIDGDVIFAKITPCMENGKAAIAQNLMNGIGFGSTEFHVLRPSHEATPEWLYGLIRLQTFRLHAKNCFTGTAGQQRVPTDFIMNYQVPIPPLQLQKNFSTAVQNLFGTIYHSKYAAQKIDDLFGLLLYRAFTGDLTAKWREAHMKELLAEMEEQAKYLEAARMEDV